MSAYASIRPLRGYIAPSAGALYAAVCDAILLRKIRIAFWDRAISARASIRPLRGYIAPLRGALYAAVCDAILLRKIRIARFAMAIAIKDQSSGAI